MKALMELKPANVLPATSLMPPHSSHPYQRPSKAHFVEADSKLTGIRAAQPSRRTMSSSLVVEDSVPCCMRSLDRSLALSSICTRAARDRAASRCGSAARSSTSRSAVSDAGLSPDEVRKYCHTAFSLSAESREGGSGCAALCSLWLGCTSAGAAAHLAGAMVGITEMPGSALAYGVHGSGPQVALPGMQIIMDRVIPAQSWMQRPGCKRNCF